MVTRSPTVIASLMNAAAVMNKPPIVDRVARDRQRRLSVVVFKSHAGWNDVGCVVLATFDLPAKPPLVIGSPKPRLVVVDGGLDVRANQRQHPECVHARLLPATLCASLHNARPRAAGRDAVKFSSFRFYFGLSDDCWSVVSARRESCSVRSSDVARPSARTIW